MQGSDRVTRLVGGGNKGEDNLLSTISPADWNEGSNNHLVALPKFYADSSHRYDDATTEVSSVLQVFSFPSMPYT